MRIKTNSLKCALAGMLTGAVNGLFGGGGGMVAVPLAEKLLGYGEKRAHATAILMIAPVCAASVVTYFFAGSFRADVAIPAAAGAVAGGYLGARSLKVMPGYLVNILFIAVMLAAGLRMLF